MRAAINELSGPDVAPVPSSPLTWAIYAGDGASEALKLLLDHGANP